MLLNRVFCLSAEAKSKEHYKPFIFFPCYIQSQQSQTANSGTDNLFILTSVLGNPFLSTGSEKQYSPASSFLRLTLPTCSHVSAGGNKLDKELSVLLLQREQC